MQLDDLGGREVFRQLFTDAHQEHGAQGKVRHDQAAAAQLARAQVQLRLVLQTDAAAGQHDLCAGLEQGDAMRGTQTRARGFERQVHTQLTDLDRPIVLRGESRDQFQVRAVPDRSAGRAAQSAAGADHRDAQLVGHAGPPSPAHSTSARHSSS